MRNSASPDLLRQNIVITMAGRSSRFFAAGYTAPKYEIMAHGQSLFQWSLLSLKHFLSPESRLIFVCLAQNRSADYVKAQCARMGLENVRLLELPELTNGQATSASLSRHLWLPNAPLLIYNIDTYVNPRALRPEGIRAGSDGWAPCFQAPGEHWSFVEVGHDGWATKVAEKRRISDSASIGLYWFARSSDFAAAYDDHYSDTANLVRGECYVAPLYNRLIDNGGKVSVADLPAEDVHVLGTPAELSAFLKKDAADIQSSN